MSMPLSKKKKTEKMGENVDRNDDAVATGTVAISNRERESNSVRKRDIIIILYIIYHLYLYNIMVLRA